MLTAITALLTIGAQNSTADSSAQAIIDWSNLNIQYLPLTVGVNEPTLSWTYTLGTVDSTAYTPPKDFLDGYDFAEDWTISEGRSGLFQEALQEKP